MKTLPERTDLCYEAANLLTVKDIHLGKKFETKLADRICLQYSEIDCWEIYLVVIMVLLHN
jgi:hypothetical protein